ncbi:MAG: acyltransferase family protein [Methylophilaceae bacterium]
MTQISPEKNKLKDVDRLVYFDYFRALAILQIILGHCYNAWPRSQVWEATVVNIISGGTALFVFISGFFFHHVYFRKYQYWSFVKSKTKYVFLPYLILSLLYIAYFYFTRGGIVMANVINEFYGPDLSNSSLVIMNLLTGRTLWAYWYVPFAMLLFLLSPIFIRFISFQLKTKVLITVGLFLFSMYVQRPSWEINPIHSLIYYCPYYLFGILYSMERAKINQWIEGKTLLLLLITIATALIMFLLGQKDSMGKASIFMWHGVDLMIFQKVSLIIFMLAFTMHLQQYDIPFLKITANMSFAYFFLHQWALSFMRSSGMMDFKHGFEGVLFIFTAAVIFSYVVARMIKRLLGSNSRYVIGW